MRRGAGVKRVFSRVPESYLLAMVFMAPLVLGIILNLTTMAERSHVAVLNATATRGGFYLVLRFDTNVSGVFAEYSPLYYSTKLWSVGTCNGTRSDLAHFTRGQVAVCHFPATLPNGTRYTLNVLTVDPQGYTWVLARGVEVRAICQP